MLEVVRDSNKIEELINGKSVLYYSLTAFDCNDYIDDIIIAVKNEEIDKVQNIIKESNISKNTKLVLGGNSRNKSVYNCIIINTTQRNNTWLVQTPQAFSRKILLKMHNKYQNGNANDDCELLEKGHYKLKILEGSYTNIKITTYEDLIISEKFLSL